MTDWQKLIALPAAAGALALLLWPPDAFTPEMARAAALCVFALGLFASGLFPEHVTAVLDFLIAMLCAVAPAGVVFSGFHSTAFWLIFGGVVISAAVRETGLGARVAGAVAARLRPSYPAIVAGLAAFGLFTVFLIPSGIGRVVVFVPLVMAVADRFGFVEGTRGRTGILIAFSFCAIFPGFTILPANVPNVVLMGGIESQYGLRLSYAEYMLLHFPVLGLLKCAVVVALVWLLYREAPRRHAGEGREDPFPPAPRAPGNAEWRLAAIVGAALLLWIFDFLHHVSPGWVALGAALLCLTPGVGVLPATAFAAKIDFTPMFTSAAILGVAGLVAYSGVGEHLGHAMLETADLSRGDQGKTLVSLVATSIGVGLAATAVGVPAVMTPLAGGVSEATGMPLDVVLMTQAVAYSTVLLPYQLPPLLVAAQVAGLGLAVTSRFCLLLAAVTMAVLFPLDFLWWSMLGYLD